MLLLATRMVLHPLATVAQDMSNRKADGHKDSTIHSCLLKEMCELLAVHGALYCS